MECEEPMDSEEIRKTLIRLAMFSENTTGGYIPVLNEVTTMIKLHPSTGPTCEGSIGSVVPDDPSPNCRCSEDTNEVIGRDNQPHLAAINPGLENRIRQLDKVDILEPLTLGNIRRKRINISTRPSHIPETEDLKLLLPISRKRKRSNDLLNELKLQAPSIKMCRTRSEHQINRSSERQTKEKDNREVFSEDEIDIENVEAEIQVHYPEGILGEDDVHTFQR